MIELQNNQGQTMTEQTMTEITQPTDAQELREGFTAADMATVSAQGFRDGVASVSAGSEPVAWKHDCAALLANDVELWIDACPHCGKPRMHATQAAHPSPPEGMAGRLQVYRCKIKSKKQIDKEIPREQQGWWADVAAGQKLLLRQAVQSDLDRCTLGGKRSRNPADYMCETENHGSLVSKVALEYMNPEQNVFADAAPTQGATEMENLQRTAVGWQGRALRAERNWAVCRRWAIAGGAPVEKLGDDPDQPFHAASPAIEGESNG